MKSSQPLDSHHTAARGRFSVAVIDAKTGAYVQPFRPWEANLILDAGLDMIGARTWAACLYAVAAGTSNTPTKDLPDGFYSQAGTTVTRESGTRDFISGDVGKLIRFEDGTERKITAFTDAANVTVATTGAVPLAPAATAITVATSDATTLTLTAAAHGLAIGDRVVVAGMTPAGYNGTWTVDTVPTADTLTITSAVNPGPGTVFGTVTKAYLPIKIYRVNQTGLITETDRSATTATFTDDDGKPSNTCYRDDVNALVTLRRCVDLPEQVSSRNYTEIGVSHTTTPGANLFSRILLSGAVTVLAGQQLRVKYELTIKVGHALVADQITVEGGITGWPRPYNIESITSSGAAWTMTLDEAHHYSAGGKININGALRPKATLTAASSTVSDFTITAAGHGRSPGDSIVIEGVTPSGYNGTFTVASVSGDDITVTSALNPGTGTVLGTVRQATPSPWYDGEHTIASVTSTTVVITSALSIAAAGASGTAYNNTKRKLVCFNAGIQPTGGSTGSTFLNGMDRYDYGVMGLDTPSIALSPSPAPGINDYHTFTNLALVVAANVSAFRPLGFPRAWYGATFSPSNYGNTQSSGSKCVNDTPAADIGATYHGAPSTTARVAVSAYTAGNFYQDTVFTFTAGEANLNTIKQVLIGAGWPSYAFYIGNGSDAVTPQAYIDFEEPQRKDNTHKLTFTVRRSWGRDLTTEPS